LDTQTQSDVERVRTVNLTKGDLEQAVSQSGLHMATYSPGDGVTRYRFFNRSSARVGYFESDGLFTALGRKEAYAFARGYLASAERRDR
jgi:hypothetical protein